MKDVRKGHRALILQAKGKYKNQFKVRYVNAKRKTIGTSGENYKRRQGCDKNIVAMLKLFGGERVLVIDKTKYDAYWLYADGHKESFGIKPTE